MTDQVRSRAGTRVPVIDHARGVALLAMILYHLGWDLSFFGLIDADLRDHAGWTWFGRAIAASFLLLVGMSLVLAHRAGFDRAAFLRRLGIVAGAAFLVTAATYLVLPESFVFFGILHAIALGSVLALPFLALPVILPFVAAAVVFALPSFVQGDALSAPWIVWLGLGTSVPNTYDFVPILPWFGFILLGIGITRLTDSGRLARADSASRPARLLAWLGRKSLIVYLLHQPILFGALWLQALVLQPKLDTEAAGFFLPCRQQCEAAGSSPVACTRLCRCAIDALKAEGLWDAVLADRLDPAQRQRLEAISRRCATAPLPFP